MTLHGRVTPSVSHTKIRRATKYTPGLMGSHIENQFAGANLYTLYYNPTESFSKDGIETFRDKLGFLGLTTPVTKKFSQVLSDVQNKGIDVSWVVHSQGGAIFSEAVRYNGGNLSRNSVAFHAGANNQSMTNHYLNKAKINLGKETTYRDSRWDLVPNIIGLNTMNPAKLIDSVVASPLLILGGPKHSPHTLPPVREKASNFSKGIAP